MASDAIIIQQIESTAEGRYQEWLIGVTKDAATRKAELGNPLNWLQWQADSDAQATMVQRHFTDLGMHKDRVDKSGGATVYILLADVGAF